MRAEKRQLIEPLPRVTPFVIAAALVLGMAVPALMADPIYRADSLLYPYYTHYALQASNDLQENEIGDNVQQTSYSGSVSTSVVGANGATAATSVSISPESLAVTSQSSGGPVFFDGESAAYSAADSGFFDTLSILGPSGQLGTFEINLTLDSSISGEIFTNFLGPYIPYPYPYLSYIPIGGVELLFSGVYHLLNDNGDCPSGCETLAFGFDSSSTGPQTLSATVQLMSGTEDPFGEDLTIINEEVPAYDLTFSAITSLTITPLTPGFSFTSASGDPYDGSTATPEPATWLLMAGGLGLGAIAKLRIRKARG
jgi:PEP-CTERM motif